MINKVANKSVNKNPHLSRTKISSATQKVMERKKTQKWVKPVMFCHIANHQPCL